MSSVFPCRSPRKPARPRSIATSVGLVLFSLLLGACSGSAGTTSTSTGNRILSGVAGSPSLSDATVTLLLDGGQSTVSARSGDAGAFALTVSKSLGVPLRLQVEGGTDLLTGQSNGTVLQAMSFDRNADAVRVSHLSTLAAAMARCAGEPTAGSLERAWTQIDERFDLNRPVVPASPTTLELAAELRADLLLAESAQRAATALAASAEPASVNDILEAISCDLDDDGRLNLSPAGQAARWISVYRAAEAAVTVEFLGASPHINGSQAASLIDDVLRNRSGDPSAKLASLGTGTRLPALATRNLTLLLGTAPDDLTLRILLALAVGGSERINDTLTSRTLTDLWALPEAVALFEDSRLAELSERAAAQTQAAAPRLALSADAAEIEQGANSTLSWASSNASLCQASDGWNGRRALTGVETVGPLNASAAYSLTCIGLGGLVQTSTAVAVVDRAARPVVSLSADSPRLTAGQGTTIRWTSVNATACRASGAWQGAQPIVGSLATGALSSARDYELVCTGPGGSDSATLRISVDPAPVPAPTLSLSASPQNLTSGASTRLSWNAANATNCQASGAWSGSRATSGSENTGPLTANASFTLNCSGPGGSIRRTVSIAVDSAPAPRVSLAAESGIVNSGSTLRLSWDVDNATSCQASGGWSGSRATSGSEVVGPVTAQTTFSLSCSGAGGSALDMVAVRVNGTATLNWQAPTENVDGSPLTDLAGYRVYYGEASRNYTEMRDVADAGATSVRLTLPSGDYYVAMTALDAEGNESAYSNEVLKQVP